MPIFFFRFISLMFLLSFVATAKAVDWRWANVKTGYASYHDEDIAISSFGLGGSFITQKNRELRQELGLFLYSGDDKSGDIRGTAMNLHVYYTRMFHNVLNKDLLLWYGYGMGSTLSLQENLIRSKNSVFVENLSSRSVVDIDVSLNAQVSYRVDHFTHIQGSVIIARSLKGNTSLFTIEYGFLL